MSVLAEAIAKSRSLTERDKTRLMYITITPDMIVNMMVGPLFRKLEDGTFEKMTTDMPSDAIAHRAWIDAEGNVSVSVASDEFAPLEPGCKMTRLNPLITSIRQEIPL